MTESSIPQSIAAAEAAAAFAGMLGTAYRVPLDASGRRTLPDRELVQRLQVPVSTEISLTDWAMMRLAADETLSAYQFGVLDIAEKCLSLALAPPALHPQFAAALQQYRSLFAAAAIPADGWITNPQHPARALLPLLYSAGLGWQPELGTTALSIRGQVTGWLDALCAGTVDWTQAVAQATQWLGEERRRAERVEKRLVETEAGVMRDRRARQLAARTLNHAFADRLVGQEVAAMLVNDWLPAMQAALLRHGEQSPLWQKLKRTTGTLRWTLSPELGEDARNKLFRLIAQVGTDLEELAPQLFFDDAVRERVMAVLDQEHLHVARNLPRAIVPFTPVDTQDTLAEANATLSDNLLEKVRALAIGDWLLLQEGSPSRRARVLLRDDDARQLLLVNVSGVKVMAAPWEKLALMLANGSAERLPERPPLNTAISQVIEETRVLHQQAQQSRMESLRQMREAAAADARAKEAARQKALAEAQALEAARQEAQRKADITQQEVNATRESGLQRARLFVSSLTIGAWLVFRGEGNAVMQRKLAVILPSSGKYIFVDATGGNKLEVNRDELVRGIGEGRIAALGKDQKLDDSLARVVSGLRNERNPPGGPF